jgi:hypothetical protein
VHEGKITRPLKRRRLLIRFAEQRDDDTVRHAKGLQGAGDGKSPAFLFTFPC